MLTVGRSRVGKIVRLLKRGTKKEKVFLDFKKRRDAVIIRNLRSTVEGNGMGSLDKGNDDDKMSVDNKILLITKNLQVKLIAFSCPTRIRFGLDIRAGQ